MSRNKTINSNAFAYLKSFLHPDVKVLDVYVWGKWLTAVLSSGIRFSVRNKDID